MVEVVIGLGAIGDVLERVALGVVEVKGGLWAAAISVRTEADRVRRIIDALEPVREAIRQRLI